MTPRTASFASLGVLCLAVAGAGGTQPGELTVRSGHKTSAKGFYWPTKSGDNYRSGDSTVVAPHDLSTAAWTFVEPEGHLGHSPIMHVFHASPIIDGDSNTYIPSTTGWVYSLDADGNLRWSTLLDGGNPGNLALLGSGLFAGSDDGSAYSLDPATGAVIWKTKISKGLPKDTYSVLAALDTVILPTPPPPPGQGEISLVALNATTGAVKWTYNILDEAYNVGPAVLPGDELAFTDARGGFYRLAIEDGKELFKIPAPTPADPLLPGAGFTTAGAPAFYVGARPAGVGSTPGTATAFIASNPAKTTGLLRAIDTTSGEVLWSRADLGHINAAPALGPAGPGGKLSLVVLVGDNPGFPPTPKLEDFLKKLGVKIPEGKFSSSVLLLDAWTGATLWSFDTPVHHSNTCAGNTWQTFCLPDVWGAASIGGDGTVYANWSGGWVWALRDANGDGVLDSSDPEEVSGYEHGGGANSNPALAPGLLVVSSCYKLNGFKA